MTKDVLQLMDDWGPERVVCVSDPRTGMRGVLVIDNTSRGMGKGGTRMSTSITVGEVARLARVMTWKWAAVDLFFGGAKAGIMADPQAKNREAVIRSWARALAKEIPSDYALGLDMGLTERDAAVVQDELGDRGAAVGSPAELGGIPYDQIGVAGFGAAEGAAAAAEVIGLGTKGARVVIQGFGALGAAAARRFGELGATVVAVSTEKGVVHDPDGLDVAALLAAREEIGDSFVLEHAKRTNMPLGTELLIAADIVVPAAVQDVIDADLAAKLDAKLLVEGANLPTDAAAQRVLKERGIPVVPDFIANAGGVIAAAFAMEARYSAFRPEIPPVMAEISSRIRANTELVLEEATRNDCTSHESALRLAQSRVRAAMELKGRWNPQ
jgi:glutamate dehydrogenase (NAD(P)+)